MPYYPRDNTCTHIKLAKRIDAKKCQINILDSNSYAFSNMHTIRSDRTNRPTSQLNQTKPKTKLFTSMYKHRVSIDKAGPWLLFFLHENRERKKIKSPSLLTHEDDNANILTQLGTQCPQRFEERKIKRPLIVEITMTTTQNRKPKPTFKKKREGARQRSDLLIFGAIHCSLKLRFSAVINRNVVFSSRHCKLNINSLVWSTWNFLLRLASIRIWCVCFFFNWLAFSTSHFI